MISLICEIPKKNPKPKTENRFMAARGSGCKDLLFFSHSLLSDLMTPWTAARQASLSFTISWILLKLISIESVVYMYGINVCRLTIFSSVVPFSSCLQPFPASGSFLMSQFFVSDGQSIEVSTSVSVLSMNIQY